MKKLVIGSTDGSAGKTSMIVGLAKAMGKTFGYMKPFGDRSLYRKKRLWDYDAALMTNVFGLTGNAEDVSMGFDHSKLRYMYDEKTTVDKLIEMASVTGKDKDILFVEAGMDLACAASVNLDAISVAKSIGGKLLIVVSGNEGAILDRLTFVKKYVDLADVELGGVLVNKVHDIEDFKYNYLDDITEMGINVLAVVPYKPELTYLSVDYLSYSLFAKVLAGEDGLNNIVKNVLVGAMSADAVLRKPVFKKERKLIITGGDRSDMILAALDSDTAGIVLTNNIIPPSNIISKAADCNVPLLLVHPDTFQVAKQIDDMDALLTKDNAEKIELLGQLILKHVNFNG